MKHLLMLLPIAMLAVACTTNNTNAAQQSQDKSATCEQLKNRMEGSSTTPTATVGNTTVPLQSEWYATSPDEKAQLMEEYKQNGCDDLITISK
jgi:hypothetical protein